MLPRNLKTFVYQYKILNSFYTDLLFLFDTFIRINFLKYSKFNFQTLSAHRQDSDYISSNDKNIK